MEDSTPHKKESHPARSDAAIQRTTTATVVVLAAIAAVVSYRHMHELALRHGEASWSAALAPLSVDGMIGAASLALLVDSRAGRRGGVLPWTFLLLGIGASLAANVAVAEPTLIGRVIAAWPSLALTGAYEMLMRMIRISARMRRREASPDRDGTHQQAVDNEPQFEEENDGRTYRRGQALQREAWQWALCNRTSDGSLPSGEVLARAFERSPRWGRLVKQSGLEGQWS